MFKILFIISLVCLQHNSFSKNIAPEFTALFDSKTNAVLISWKHTSPATGTYLIQRSAEQVVFFCRYETFGRKKLLPVKIYCS